MKREAIEPAITNDHGPTRALARFIEEARDLKPYGDVSWESMSWDITAADFATRAHLANKKTLLFSEHAGSRVALGARSPFLRPFADLTKACIVKRRVNRGMGSSPQRVFIRASRYLYAALPLPVRSDPTLINRGHFVQAENAVRNREKETSAYRCGVHLDEFARTLDRHGLCRAPVDYRCSIPRPKDHVDRTSSTFAERTKRLPTTDVIDALAAISNDRDNERRPFDLLRMRISELLFVCGFRIGEVLSLPEDPLVCESAAASGNSPYNGDGAPSSDRLGLRYWPEKGGEPIVKWIPTVANPLVLRALQDIERLCGPARQNAKWLEKHPGNVNLDVDENDFIELPRVREMLGLERTTLNAWFTQRKRGGYPSLVRHGAYKAMRAADLRRALVSDRYDEPVLRRTDGKVQTLGDSLLVIFMYDSSERRPTSRYISVPMIWGQMSAFLCGRGGMPSVFERCGYVDDAGRPFRMTSHDFRRFVNMLAQRGGLSQQEIARWMGRRHLGDNAAYDLRTATEMAEEMRVLISKNQMYGVIADQVKQMPEAECGVFLKARLAMVHTTPLGQCASNIAESPCATAVSCLGGCRQYLRRKGDLESRRSLERIERETLVSLEAARQAMVQGKYNAENWVLSQETVLRTARAALAIDDDLATEAGEIRHVTPDGPLLGESM